jgi:kynurenine formamidase
MRYLDLTRLFQPQMPVFPGDPPAELVQVADVRQDESTNFEVRTGMHVGTHLDGPLHMIAGGKKLSEMAVEKFFGRGVLLDVRRESEITASVLDNIELRAGDILFLLTGIGQAFGQADYFEQYPKISLGFAQKLVEAQVCMLGLDASTPDMPPFPIHKILLQNEILILENLTNLEELLGVAEFEIIALPTKFEADSAPARVVAKIL